MTPFEFVFAVFGLLLGLAVAEVLSGFARTIKLRRKVRIGWLTPLLGVLVILDLMTLWLTAWAMRDIVAANYLTLLAVLAMIGGYYLFATLIFPDEPAEWPDFDLWYDQHNRLVLGGMVVINLFLFGVSLVIAAVPELLATIEATARPRSSLPGGVDGLFAMVLAAGGLLHLPLLIALIFVKSRRANIAMLALLIGFILLGALGSAF
jgi:hypothetical protein